MLVCDIYHITQEMRGPEDVLASGSFIRHCHIAEDAERAAPGTRGDDFVPFFRALKRVGYQGRISVECRWTDKPAELPVALDTMKDQIAKV